MAGWSYVFGQNVMVAVCAVGKGALLRMDMKHKEKGGRGSNH